MGVVRNSKYAHRYVICAMYMIEIVLQTLVMARVRRARLSRLSKARDEEVVKSVTSGVNRKGAAAAE